MRVGTWCTVSSGSMILAIAMVVSALGALYLLIEPELNN